jgi:hypothetical protein
MASAVCASSGVAAATIAAASTRYFGEEMKQISDIFGRLFSRLNGSVFFSLVFVLLLQWQL